MLASAGRSHSTEDVRERPLYIKPMNADWLSVAHKAEVIIIILRARSKRNGSFRLKSTG